jgi:hypothetical protein
MVEETQWHHTKDKPCYSSRWSNKITLMLLKMILQMIRKRRRLLRTQLELVRR